MIFAGFLALLRGKWEGVKPSPTGSRFFVAVVKTDTACRVPTEQWGLGAAHLLLDEDKEGISEFCRVNRAFGEEGFVGFLEVVVEAFDLA